MAKNEIVEQLKVKLKDAWVRGKEQRIEIGTLLIELRAQAEHGEWGKLLVELGIPAGTARDYMVEASRQIHGIRVFGKAPDPKPIDVEAEELERAINQAMAQVEEVGNGNTPTPISEPKPQANCKQSEVQLAERNKVKGPVLHCTADQKDAYRAARKADYERVYRIFHAALMEVIGEQEEVCDEAVAA